MNTIHNNGENDKTLDDGLEKLGHAYEQLQHEEPPELLDQAILNSAHRAVEKRSHWMQFGWLHGLTTAAVFVLALSLIFNTREPVPDYENGMRLDEAAGLERDKAGKKQSLGAQSDDMRTETKEENENRQDVFQDAPVSTAPQEGQMKISTGDQAAEPAIVEQRSRYVQEKLKSGTAREAGPGQGLQAKTDSADKDASVNEPTREEELSDEAVSITRIKELDALSAQQPPASAATISVSEVETPLDTETGIEQRLLEIINLKKSGDETWASQLESFMEDHPDYPVPEELLN